ncbi:nitrate reductase associated protein [Asaia sp. HN010]|uniref:nitrate reductase associated protein n=1 Tax=Asaia sp. HN010 TaxID=3081233 RepID=UPI0030174C6D
MSFDPHSDFFAFEQDFAGTLRCIPMRVRLKLDCCGIKLSLRQWSQFPPQTRRDLLNQPCETAPDQAAYHDRLLALIAAHCDEPPKALASNDDLLWRDTSSVPDCVLAQALRDDVQPPSLTVWQTLDPLQRFVLVKLARSRHENENFVPALQEFDLI